MSHENFGGISITMSYRIIKCLIYAIWNKDARIRLYKEYKNNNISVIYYAVIVKEFIKEVFNIWKTSKTAYGNIRVDIRVLHFLVNVSTLLDWWYEFNTCSICRSIYRCLEKLEGKSYGLLRRMERVRPGEWSSVNL